MKKAANRKARHKVRRAHARSPGACSHAPTSSLSATSDPHTPAAIAPNLRGPAADGRQPLAAPIATRSPSTPTAVAWLQRLPKACARAIPLPAEDREILALLIAPFVILTLALAGNQSLNFARHLRVLIARPVAPPMLPVGNDAARQIAPNRDLGAQRLVRLTPAHPHSSAPWITAPGDAATPHTFPDRIARPFADPDTLPASKSMSAIDPALARDVRPASLTTSGPYPGHQVAARLPPRPLQAQTAAISSSRLVLNLAHPQSSKTWITAPGDAATPHAFPDRIARRFADPDTLPASGSTPAIDPAFARGVRPALLTTSGPYPGHQVAARPPPRPLQAQIAAISSSRLVLTTAAPQWQTAEPALSGPMLALVGADAMDAFVAFDEQRDMATQRISLFKRCSLPAADNPAANSHVPLAPATWFSPAGKSSFGQRLAAASRRQLGEFIIYNDAYRRISYPRGDVPKLYGVCTDVVIRAYRDLGIDLQVAVHNAHVGSGDRSIDHRRTETLRRFFQRAGESLPITSFPEDYLPGDIVTYARPQNTGTASRSHIAMVADMVAPSGRPMIVHNRGWGPQLEDALFVDRITGHYRYSGPHQSQPVSKAITKPLEASRPAIGEHPRIPSRSRRTASNQPSGR